MRKYLAPMALVAAGIAAGTDPQVTYDIPEHPRLYELVRQVIPSTKMPGNVYVGRTR